MEPRSSSGVKPIRTASKFIPLLLLVILCSIVGGVGTGYVLASKSQTITTSTGETVQTAQNAHQDNQTFRDFAEGTITKKPESKKPDEYAEGTHILVREGKVPVALTSSVVDLSLYDGKKVKVYGETQKAVKEGWLMDVGRVESE